MKITIKQANGWTKLFEPIKAVSLVGSADFADIQLSSSSISPIHIQILSDRQFSTGFRVVGIDGQTKVNTVQGTFFLDPFTTYDISEDDEIVIGEYVLEFQSAQGFSKANSTGNITAQLKFPDTNLHPNLDLTGVLIISNAGEMDACQFDVRLDGIPEDCYQLDPVPMLHPGGQEEIYVRLFHRKTSPPAGNLDLVFTVTAPNSYPGEADKVKQRIYVAPDFSQSLKIVDDLTASVEPAKKYNNSKQTNSNTNSNPQIKNTTANIADINSPFTTAKANQTPTITKLSELKSDESDGRQRSITQMVTDNLTRTDIENPPAEDKTSLESAALPEQQAPYKAQNLDLKKVKIVQNKSEDFWEES